MSKFTKSGEPSLGNHFECVPVECDTIEKALAWRNHEWEIDYDFNEYNKPLILT